MGELGVTVKIVFIYPNTTRDKVKNSYENVDFIYLWDAFSPKNKYLKHLVSRFFLLFYIVRLKKNETVLVYGTINPWFAFLFNPALKVFNEITEHPSVHIHNNKVIGKLQYYFFKKFCLKINGIITITPSLSQFFISEFGIKKEKVTTINMIVDSFRFENIVVEERKNTITYCGTISESKDGISYLLNAFKTVLSHHPEMTLTLIGGFESAQTKDNVYKLIHTLSIEDKVIITGEISSDEMPLLLAESKLLVLSRPNSIQAQYGFPTKLGEYLMTKNPIVITDVGDFKMYLKDKHDIIYTIPDDAEDFAAKINWVLNNYSIALQIGANGKNVAMQSFNYKIEAQKLLDFTNI
ncbi:hypothetical protein B0A61_04385 [Flavobacterium aquatile LMG 4008 = ATCC 11947]|uniref:Glycosyl transferase family 1 domain-containing protein n=2 Tax=Flavobacterium aquatile TaxID=245 RepID=A0A095UZY0_9FLAO|nr:hypothetical protein LG45_07405 [Flavobacterium aquatile LMG 4008 = ATCC 11947]OXA68948.1 hypothetical protein B0A61_04385 [Flavobacterium aquatile LMG 4008 = ATCC 11947]